MQAQNRTLYQADAIEILQRLDSSQFTLVYIDPPWGTSRGMVFRPQEDSLEYEDFISRLLQHCWRVLNDQGSLYFHAPPVSGTSFRLILDQVFGRPPSSVIAWKYGRYNIASKVSKLPLPTHEDILRYSKTHRSIYNIVRLPPKKEHFTENDTRGPYRLRDLTVAGNRPNRQYEWWGSTPQPERSWRLSHERMDQYFSEGRIVQNKGRLPYIKQYFDEILGPDIGSVWDDIPPTAPSTDYNPLAKPAALYDRIIRQATNEGDFVLDPFCGSGQLLFQSEKLGRRWCGCDSAAGAIEATQRLLEQESGFGAGCVNVVEGNRVAGIPPVSTHYENIFLTISEVESARHKLTKLVDFMVVMKAALRAERRSDEEILSALQDAIPRLKWLVADAAKETCAKKIAKRIPGFYSLEDNSKEFLLTSIAILETLPDSLDFSVVSVSAWKAVENEIGQKLFHPLRRWVVSGSHNLKERYEADLKCVHGVEANELANFIVGGRIPALGTLRFILNKISTSKKTIENSLALQSLHEYVSATLVNPDFILSRDGIYSLWKQEDIDKYRNGAVHTSTFTKDRASESLEFVLCLTERLCDGLKE